MNTPHRIPAAALRITSARLPAWNAGGHLQLHVHGVVGSRRYEFARLRGSSMLEVYDYPRAWGGVARFLGYAPQVTSAARLRALAERWIEDQAKTKGP